jgi:hypothetical protein
MTDPKPTEPVSPPGDSSEQRGAEAIMLALLGQRLHADLLPRTIVLPNGSRVAIDGVSDAPPILVEAWAHQGGLRGGQPKKVMTDAFKLAFVASLNLFEVRPRLVLLFSDEAAAAPFRGKSWHAAALQAHAVELAVVDLPPDARLQVVEAQKRQSR